MDYRVGPIASMMWQQMKNYSVLGCQPGGAGEQLMEDLQTAAPKRIILIGHSAGSIYINHFLKMAERVLPTTKFDVLFLAPAITYSDLANNLAAYRSVEQFRTFALSDGLEQADHVLTDAVDFRKFPIVGTEIEAAMSRSYKGSLLYFISNALEGQEDTPLFGMQRFWTLDETQRRGDAEAREAIQNWLGANDAFVWSSGVPEPENEIPGRACSCTTHGGFVVDHATDFSLERILLDWSRG
jgi:hypothetical protein